MFFNLSGKNHNKPTIGIIPPPMITPDKDKYLYLNDDYIKFLRQKHLNIIIIPYNISKPSVDLYLKNVDGLFLSGARIGNYNQEPEFIQQYTFIDYVLKKAIELNKKGRIFPVYASCHGIQSIVKTSEKKIHVWRNDEG